jgi:preprotein translocase subunit SecG
MSTVLLIVHLFVTLALIGVVLIQRSEGGGLGIGTSQGMGSFMSGRGTANLLSRTTAILATLFMALALVLALLDRGATGGGRSIMDIPPTATPVANPTPTSPGTAPSATEPAVPGATVPGAAAPAAPAQPSSGSPSTAPGSLAAPAPAASPAPAAPAPGSTSSPTEPAVPGAAAPGSAAPIPPKGAPAVPTN